MALLQFAVKGNVREMLDNFDKVKTKSKQAAASMMEDAVQTNKMFEAQTGTMLAAGAATVGMMWGMAKVSPLVGSLLQQFGDALGYIVTMLVLDYLPAVESVIDVMYDFGEWLETAPAPIKAVLLLIMALPVAYTAWTVAMAAAGVAQKMLIALDYLQAAAQTILAQGIWATTAAMLANPMTWVVIGIVALIAALYLLWKHWDDVTAAVGRFSDWFNAKFKPLIDFITGGFEFVIAIFKSLWDLLITAAETWYNIFVKPFVDGVQKIMDIFGISKDTIMGALDAIWDGIVWIGQSIWNIFVQPWIDAWNWITGLFSWDKLSSSITGIIDGITDFVGNIDDIFWDFVEGAWQWGVDMIQKFIDGILSMVGKVGDAAKEAFDSVGDWLSFDIKANDRMAQKWGQDLAGYFNEGLQMGSLSGGASSVQAGAQSALGASSVGGGMGGITVNITGNTISNQLDLNDIVRRVNEGIRGEIARGI